MNAFKSLLALAFAAMMATTVACGDKTEDTSTEAAAE